MTNFKLKICKATGKEFKQYNSLQKCPCCNHSKPLPTQKKVYVIPKISPKRKADTAKYLKLKEDFLNLEENKVCPITGNSTIEVHHTYCGKDRNKYYLDVSTWIAVSRKGHDWIHSNPIESRELGYLK